AERRLVRGPEEAARTEGLVEALEAGPHFGGGIGAGCRLGAADLHRGGGKAGELAEGGQGREALLDRRGVGGDGHVVDDEAQGRVTFGDGNKGLGLSEDVECDGNG